MGRVTAALGQLTKDVGAGLKYGSSRVRGGLWQGSKREYHIGVY